MNELGRLLDDDGRAVLVEWMRRERTLSQEDVDRVERERESRRGLYAPHGGSPHHTRGESQH